MAVLILITLYKDSCDNATLLRGVSKLRKHLRRTHLETSEMWREAWDFIQSSGAAFLLEHPINLKSNMVYPCKACSNHNKTCDRRRPICKSCEVRGCECRWLSFVEVFTRKMLPSCLECLNKHRICDRARPGCSLCDLKGRQCRWPGEEKLGSNSEGSASQLTLRSTQRSSEVADNALPPADQEKSTRKRVREPSASRVES
jgi:hypothetical protein